MDSPFRREIWRIAKYILISLAVSMGIRLLYPAAVSRMLPLFDSPGQLLTLLAYVQILLEAVVSCLVHRYFTFRSSETWYIALLWMLFFALGMQMLGSVVLTAASRLGSDAVVETSYLIAPGKLLLAYLFQRFLLYRHSTDKGGWFTLRHPTNDTEGATPNE